jgi:hypothetical protein
MYKKNEKLEALLWSLVDCDSGDLERVAMKRLEALLVLVLVQTR